jgi:hypothetical protein
MKYIKTYESKEEEWYNDLIKSQELKLGDYVVIKHIAYKKNTTEDFCKITSLPTFNNSTYYGEKIDGISTLFFRDDIIRKMNKNEIEQFEMKKDANKYNL